MWFLYALLSALTASAVAIFGKLGLKNIDSGLATTVRSVIMAALLVLMSLFLKKFQGFSLHSFDSRQWLYIFLAGVAGAASWLFYFLALEKGMATRVAAIDRLSIIFVIFFAALFLGEIVGWKTVLGGIFMILGALLITLQ